MKLLKTALLLGIVCFLSAFSLGKVFEHTKERIAALSRPETFLKILIPEAENFSKEHINEKYFYTASDNEGKIIGYLIPTTKRGYAGSIKILLAINSEGKVINFQILKHSETPGLGAKINDPSFLAQFSGKKDKEILLSKDSPLGQIEAITSATISSRAVVEAIDEGLIFYEQNIKQPREDIEEGF